VNRAQQALKENLDRRGNLEKEVLLEKPDRREKSAHRLPTLISQRNSWRRCAVPKEIRENRARRALMVPPVKLVHRGPKGKRVIRVNKARWGHKENRAQKERQETPGLKDYKDLPELTAPRGNRGRRGPQVRTERVPIPPRRRADIPETRPALTQILRL